MPSLFSRSLLEFDSPPHPLDHIEKFHDQIERYANLLVACEQSALLPDPRTVFFADFLADFFADFLARFLAMLSLHAYWLKKIADLNSSRLIA